MIATQYTIKANPITKPQRSSLIEAIITGSSVNQWCKDSGVNQAHVYAAIERDPDFAELYRRAKDLQAETIFDRILDIADRTLDGKVDPQAARVAIDAQKWIVSKLLPKKYGDRQQIDIHVNNKQSMIDHAIEIMEAKNVTPRSKALESGIGD